MSELYFTIGRGRRYAEKAARLGGWRDLEDMLSDLGERWEDVSGSYWILEDMKHPPFRDGKRSKVPVAVVFHDRFSIETAEAYIHPRDPDFGYITEEEFDRLLIGGEEEEFEFYEENMRRKSKRLLENFGIFVDSERRISEQRKGRPGKQVRVIKGEWKSEDAVIIDSPRPGITYDPEEIDWVLVSGDIYVNWRSREGNVFVVYFETFPDEDWDTVVRNEAYVRQGIAQELERRGIRVRLPGESPNKGYSWGYFNVLIKVDPDHPYWEKGLKAINKELKRRLEKELRGIRIVSIRWDDYFYKPLLFKR